MFIHSHLLLWPPSPSPQKRLLCVYFSTDPPEQEKVSSNKGGLTAQTLPQDSIQKGSIKNREKPAHFRKFWGNRQLRYTQICSARKGKIQNAGKHTKVNSASCSWEAGYFSWAISVLSRKWGWTLPESLPKINSFTESGMEGGKAWWNTNCIH